MAATFLPKKFIGTTNLSQNENKTTEKLKTVLKEVAKSSILKTGLNMRKNRGYIYSELFLINKLIGNSPGLLGSKFPKILCCLSYAKNEILMYFNHNDQIENLRKDTKKHYNNETYKDTNILKLLSLVLEVTKFIEKYLWVVIQYNTEYLILNDFHSLNKTLDLFKEMDPKMSPYVRSMVNPLHEFVIENEEKDDFLDETFSIVQHATFNLQNEISTDTKNHNNNDEEEKFSSFLTNERNENDFTVLKNSNSLLENFRNSCHQIITHLSFTNKNEKTTSTTTNINTVNNINTSNNDDEVEGSVSDRSPEKQNLTFRERNMLSVQATENAKKLLIFQAKTVALYEQLHIQMLATYERTLFSSKNSLFLILKEFIIPYEILFFHVFCEKTLTDSLESQNFPSLSDLSQVTNTNAKNVNASFLNLNLTSTAATSDTIVNNSNDDINNNLTTENKNMEYGILNDDINNYSFFILFSYQILNVHIQNKSEEKHLIKVSNKMCNDMEILISKFFNKQMDLLFIENEKLNTQISQITMANKIEYILSLKNVKNTKKSIFDFTTSNNNKFDKIEFNDNNSMEIFDRKKSIENIEFKMSHIFEIPGEESKYIKYDKRRIVKISNTITDLVNMKRKISNMILSAQNIVGVQIHEKYYNLNFISFKCIINYFQNSLCQVFDMKKNKKSAEEEIKSFGEKILNFLSICQNTQFLLNFLKLSNFYEIFHDLLFMEIDISNSNQNLNLDGKQIQNDNYDNTETETSSLPYSTNNPPPPPPLPLSTSTSSVSLSLSLPHKIEDEIPAEDNVFNKDSSDEESEDEIEVEKEEVLDVGIPILPSSIPPPPPPPPLLSTNDDPSDSLEREEVQEVSKKLDETEEDSKKNDVGEEDSLEVYEEHSYIPPIPPYTLPKVCVREEYCVVTEKKDLINNISINDYYFDNKSKNSDHHIPVINNLSKNISAYVRVIVASNNNNVNNNENSSIYWIPSQNGFSRSISLNATHTPTGLDRNNLISLFKLIGKRGLLVLEKDLIDLIKIEVMKKNMCFVIFIFIVFIILFFVSVILYLCFYLYKLFHFIFLIHELSFYFLCCQFLHKNIDNVIIFFVIFTF